ncbi:GDSL esterase/lipase At5g45910-like [Lolium perenne]|uniref:GDSL esterase/lipase At5g45910-like n=1 Tax=Lolium perenne TaxID=4522 RepID=UPI0021EA9815|nr:GDSL esterase/lipase At5g45910-like [Lolium perenne]
MAPPVKCTTVIAAAAGLLLGASLFFQMVSATEEDGQGRYNAMFNFGDSLSDTGNICVNKSATAQLLLTFANPPYGMTYFGHPTCRCSDGRLVVDFLAQSLGLPLLPPSKLSGADFRKGANMAIVGATALDFDFLKSIGLGYPIWNNGAINVQLQWFRDLLPRICGGTPQTCKPYLAKSLFVLGSIGGNDYNAMLFFGFTVDRARSYVPNVVDNIAAGVERLIDLGAVDIVVPGTLPIGCYALYLTMLPSVNKSDYDEHGCLRPLNDLAVYHNTLLQDRLGGVRARHGSAVRVMYADFYTHAADMLRDPPRFGFTTAVTACCGAGGGAYNYEFDARCGMKGATACKDPWRHESWDGVHPTEAVNKLFADGWLRGPYCHPPILH